MKKKTTRGVISFVKDVIMKGDIFNMKINAYNSPIDMMEKLAL